MTEPGQEYEKKILLNVVEQMKDPEETSRKQDKLRRVIYGLGYAGLLVAFIMALNRISHPLVPSFIAALSGFAIGFAEFLKFAQKQWPITRAHIDMESVKRRLKELGNP